MENLLFIIVFVGVVLYIIFDWQKLSRDLYRCPVCNANGQDIKKIGEEDFGKSISNHNIQYSRNIYSCDKCNHRWTLSKSLHKNRKN